MTHSYWLLILTALAVFRLTRLFTTDTITRPLRELELKLGSWVIAPGVFLTCDWCVSVWFGAGAVWLMSSWNGWPYVAAALSFSAVTGIVSERT